MQAVGPTGHSIYGMSVLERRIACPGSAQAEMGRPDTSSAAADRGTLLHEAAAKALLSGVDADDVLEDDDQGVEIVQAYLDEVRATHDRLGGTLLVEHRFHLTDIADELWGTADAVIVAPPRVAVLDLKTGGGHFVPVTKPDGRPNVQLAGYSLGGMQAVPKGVVIDDVELVVVQPLRGGVQRAIYDSMDIADLGVDLLEAVTAGNAENPERRASDECRWCKARLDCPALRQAAFAAAQLEFADISVDDDDILAGTAAFAPPSPTEMTPEQIANALQAAEIMDVWISAMRQHGFAEAERGRPPAGFKLVQRRGIRQWVPGKIADVAAALKTIGVQAVDIWTQPKLVSPAKVEKTLKTLKLQLDLADAVKVSNPGLTLVPVADKRPAVEPAKTAASEFDDVDPFS
jgi:hypothetical protein